jgi:hypothetical protein
VTVTVARQGITAIAIDGIDVKPAFQQQFTSEGKAWAKDNVTSTSARGSAWS